MTEAPTPKQSTVTKKAGEHRPAVVSGKLATSPSIVDAQRHGIEHAQHPQHAPEGVVTAGHPEFKKS